MLSFRCVMGFVVAAWSLPTGRWFGKGVAFFPNTEPQVAAAEIEGPLGTGRLQDRRFRSARSSRRSPVSIPRFRGRRRLRVFRDRQGQVRHDMAAGGVSESNKGYLDFKFEQYEDRKVSSWKTMAWLNDTLPKVLPGWNVKVKQQQEGPPQGKPVEYEIAGDDYKVIAHTADSVVARLKTIPELVNVTSNYNPAQPEIRVVVDREQAKNLGVSTTAVAMAIRSAMFGIEAGKYRVGKDEHKVMVRLDVDTREQLDALGAGHGGRRRRQEGAAVLGGDLEPGREPGGHQPPGPYAHREGDRGAAAWPEGRVRPEGQGRRGHVEHA
jgi:multidrug efflux pump